MKTDMTEFDYNAKAAEIGFPAARLKELLEDPDLGIFHQVDPETIGRIMAQAKPRVFKKEEAAFEYGQPTESLPINIIFEGIFSVTHIVRGVEHQIAEDDAGVVLADVELLLFGINPEVYKRGMKNCTLSTVRCMEAGRTLEIPNSLFRETRSFDLAMNLAKLVSVKLMRRNAITDEELALPPRERIVWYLQKLVTDFGYSERPGNSGTKYILKADVSPDQVATTLHILPATVKLCNDQKLFVRGLEWDYNSERDRWVFRMSKDFFDTLMENPLDLVKITRSRR